MNYKTVSILISIALGLLLSNYTLDNYTVEEDYSIKFSTKKAEGTFRGLEGTVNFNPADLASSAMNVSVDVNTIQTGNTKKDDHAKGKKWFGAEEHPKIQFDSRKIERAGQGFKVIGDLTLKGTKREEVIFFTTEKENGAEYLDGVFSVNRKDYGINGNFFGFTVGKKVDIYLKIPASFGATVSNQNGSN